MSIPQQERKWALVLGASSGFGAACSIALARSGCDIIGVHLDRRATLPAAEKVAEEVRGEGRQALFFNINAADADRRAAVVSAIIPEVRVTAGSGIHVLLHSLAFGTLKPYIAASRDAAIKPADMNMTLDIMAHSLVYWVQDLFAAGLLARGAQVVALTSAGSHRVWKSYGAVSAAKAALEAHIRQLAVELAPHGIAANAIQAGVTDTPAARKIPGSEAMFARALESNPGGRLTLPEDVARFLVTLSRSAAHWMTGNVLRVDGGEDISG